MDLMKNERLNPIPGDPILYEDHSKDGESVVLKRKVHDSNDVEGAKKIRGNRLNSKQQRIFDYISNESEEKYFFVNGPAGCGKTFLFCQMIEELDENILAVAWTGSGANLLRNGKTVNSAFHLPTHWRNYELSENIEEMFLNMSNDKESELKSIRLIIWDNIHMVSREAFEIIDIFLQRLMDNEEPFGGKIMVLGGDFRQLLPITQNGDILDSSIKKSDLWADFEECPLEGNMRVRTDNDFAEWLLKIGNGSKLNETKSQVEIPSEYISNDLITDIFGSELSSEDSHIYSKRVILFISNSEVDSINEKVLERLKAKLTYISQSEDSIENPEEVVEDLCSYNTPLLPPSKLPLKKGCVVILLKNLANGLRNGTRMIVEEVSEDELKVKVISGSFALTQQTIQRETSNASTNPPNNSSVMRNQFPVRLAFAMTIHKSQGETFEKVGLHLPQQCFAHGQLYSACSRVISADGFKIHSSSTFTCRNPEDDENPIFKTTNVVNREILN